MPTKIQIKRAYDPPSPSDGYRVLVDRLWPRGVKKEDLRIEEWLKEIAPSNTLRQWYGHEPEKWDEFRRRYREELQGHEETLDHLREIAHKGPLTLVYSAKNEHYNNAVALKEVLE